MEIGIIGLGRMGKNMALRLLRGGHQVLGYNRGDEPYADLEKEGGKRTTGLTDMVSRLQGPRTIWVMLPSGAPTEETLHDLLRLLDAGDVVIEGGNSNFNDSKRRAALFRTQGIGYLDAGTSGGIWGLQVGYCLMVGGDAADYERVEPIFKTLAPPDGCLHAGPSGAGHYTKMVHNAIEYGMMQAYAEGFELMDSSEYDFDMHAVSHLWNQGSVVRSWLLELAERAFAADPKLAGLSDWVDDSGEGRWTMVESIDRAVPMPVLAASLHARFRSRQESSYTGRMLAALRQQFGGHAVKKA